MTMTGSAIPTAKPLKTASESVETIARQVDEFLESAIEDFDLPSNLRSAVKYAVLGEGKRLRPVLTLRSCEAVGGIRRDALPAAAAIELIHNFSLVHDDLPAMDDDDLRRGKPTLHRHTSEAMAILAGDLMVSIAFRLLSEAPLHASRSVRLCSELSNATSRMIAGQVFDTLGGVPCDLEDRDRLRVIHSHKTAALIIAAVRMGGICGSATENQLDCLTRYGRAIGLMFQVIDDLLDVTQSTEHTGKATGKDQSAGKLTYPGLLGIDESQREVEKLHEEALLALDSLGSPASALRELCDSMAIRTK